MPPLQRTTLDTHLADLNRVISELHDRADTKDASA
jgi:hypothetical protein